MFPVPRHRRVREPCGLCRIRVAYDPRRKDLCASAWGHSGAQHQLRHLELHVRRKNGAIKAHGILPPMIVMTVLVGCGLLRVLVTNGLLPRLVGGEGGARKDMR